MLDKNIAPQLNNMRAFQSVAKLPLLQNCHPLALSAQESETAETTAELEDKEMEDGLEKVGTKGRGNTKHIRHPIYIDDLFIQILYIYNIYINLPAQVGSQERMFLASPRVDMMSVRRVLEFRDDLEDAMGVPSHE